MRVVALMLFGVGFSLDVYKNSHKRWMIALTVDALDVHCYAHAGHPRAYLYGRLDSRKWGRGAIGWPRYSVVRPTDQSPRLEPWYVWQKSDGREPPSYTTVKQKGDWKL